MKKVIMTLIMSICIIHLNAQMGMSNFKDISHSEILSLDNKYPKLHLRLYPIKAKKSYHKAYKKLNEKIISLETALKNNWITIKETSQSGTVNALSLSNTGEFIIYGIAGEVVLGGKQDRILGEDVLLKPSETKQVKTFCVEHGRWSTQSTGTQFKDYYNVSSNSVRQAAVVQQNQQEVWNNVKNIVEKNNATSHTGTYSALKNNEEFQKEFYSYFAAFKDLWKNDKDVIGIVAVSGDKVIGCDVFATHMIFQNSYNNLLYAYISEAITQGTPVSITYEEVQKYLHHIFGSQNPNQNLQKKGQAYTFDDTLYHLNAF